MSALCLIALVGAAGAVSGSVRPSGRIVESRAVGDGRRVLFVSRADGSAAAQVSEGPSDYNARWSPDGHWVAFERSVAEDETAVWTVNADGSAARVLDANPLAEFPRWSPNGRWIAYQVQTSEDIRDANRANTTFELWLVRTEGSGPSRRLVGSEPRMENDNARFYVEFAQWSWSPDSRRLAFTRPRTPAQESPGVNVVDVATGRVRFLGPGEDPAWSPDGKNLLVTVDAEHTIGDAGCGTTWIVPAAGGARRRLTRTHGVCGRFPRWSPDGKMIVFERQPSGHLVAVAPDGTHLRRLLPLRADAYHWPNDCSTLFEYANPFDQWWVVRDARGRDRIVSLPGQDADWRCDG